LTSCINRRIIFIIFIIKINTCQSEHDALVRAAVRCTPGYKVTGTILVLCPRHGLVRKNGVGDLQKGEK
jgi:Kyakuja-Dileera-Zisupton transposase